MIACHAGMLPCLGIKGILFRTQRGMFPARSRRRQSISSRACARSSWRTCIMCTHRPWNVHLHVVTLLLGVQERSFIGRQLILASSFLHWQVDLHRPHMSHLRAASIQHF